MARRTFERDSLQQEEDRLTASLAGLAMALALVVGGLYLVSALRAKAQVEDCLMSGRTNCPQLLVLQ